MLSLNFNFSIIQRKRAFCDFAQIRIAITPTAVLAHFIRQSRETEKNVFFMRSLKILCLQMHGLF
jgi:hypothetical protein